MRVLRLGGMAAFIAGVTAVAWVLWANSQGEPPSVEPFTPFDVATVAALSSPTVAATDVPTATATPEPFDGEVMSFRIPRFDVDAEVENIGLIPGENQLDVPSDPRKVGWYGIFDRPGWLGNTIFSAHVDYWPDIRGPFYDLSRLDPGDEVVVVMDNGQEYRYRVFRKQRYDATTIPMGDLIDATDKPTDAEWITLITCGGRFRAYLDGGGPGEYLDRDVVIAERIS